MKQVFQDKGGGGIGGGISAEAWERRFEYDVTKLEHLPVPDELPLDLGTRIDSIARLTSQSQPEFTIPGFVNDKLSLATTRPSLDRELEQMQEELDWECYRLYGLVEEKLATHNPPPLKLGQRAFEIVLARKMSSGNAYTTWFERHDSTPTTELPHDWPDEYRVIVEARIAKIEAERNIGLLEQPEYKRRWNAEP